MPILVGFAPTPEGRAAVLRAVAECGLRGTDLVLVSSERTGSELVDVVSCEREIARACAGLGVRDPGHEVRLFSGSVEPADDLLTVAEEKHAELIVIGLRRRTAVGKLILGGSAQRILLEARCPVLAVKGDGTPQAVADDVTTTTVLPASPGPERSAGRTIRLDDPDVDRLQS